MPTSRAGLIKKKLQSGFTLVEVLVVLLIFGIMAGVVVLNLPSQKNPLYELGNQMATHLERTAQSSLINRQTLGVKFSQKGYDIVRYSDGKWTSLQTFEFQKEFTPELELIKNGAPIDLKDKTVRALPLIRYDTTGLATPFDLILENDGSIIRLIGNHTGNISIKHGEFDNE